MRLLFVTQKVDTDDGPLGFVVGWLEAFHGAYESVTVICLEKRAHSLPQDVALFSLGKENGRSRLRYVLRFWKYIFVARKRYDVVLVHMNQEYVLLGALFWKLMGKRVALWYNHSSGSWQTFVAMKLVDVIFHTSPYAYTAGTKKSRRMPAGIPVNHFVLGTDARRESDVLFLGRIAPVKGVHVLIEAFMLVLSRTSLRLLIYGSALPEHHAYEETLRGTVAARGAQARVVFHPAILNAKAPALYAQVGMFVNLSPSGLYDKTVLEAMACGALPLVSSPAFNDAIPPEYRFKEGDPNSLAETMLRVSELPQEQKEAQRMKNRAYVVERHGLALLVEVLSKELGT